MKNLQVLLLALAFIIGASSQRVYGVAYGIDNNNCPTDAQLQTDFTIIKTFTDRVRIYACYPCGNICLRILNIAKPLGIQILVGLQPAPADAFSWEQGALRDIKNQIGLDGIVGVTVGSESLYRKDLTSAQLASLVNQIRNLLRNELSSQLPVGTADVYYEFDSTIIAACDQLYVNAFAYWEGQADPKVGAGVMLQHYDTVVNVAQGKPVFFGETGWPTAGPNFQAAVASYDNQAAYLASFDCQADARGIGYYLFSAFDANTGDTSTPESNFGLYTTQRTRKSSFNYQCGGSSGTTTNNNGGQSTTNNTPTPTTGNSGNSGSSTGNSATSSPSTGNNGGSTGSSNNNGGSSTTNNNGGVTPTSNNNGGSSASSNNNGGSSTTNNNGVSSGSSNNGVSSGSSNNNGGSSASSNNNGGVTPTSDNGGATPATSSDSGNNSGNAPGTVGRDQNSATSIKLSACVIALCSAMALLL